MNKRLITLTAVGALAAASLGTYSTSFAKEHTDSKAGPQAAAVAKHCKMPKKMRNAKSPWHLGLKSDKQLTQTDAKTLVSAALLMQGRHDLLVGKVETKATQNSRSLYLVTVNDAKGAAVTTVMVDGKSGHIRPLSAKPQGKVPGQQQR